MNTAKYHKRLYIRRALRSAGIGTLLQIIGKMEKPYGCLTIAYKAN